MVYMLAGWIIFPIKTLPKMTWEPAALAVAGVALAIVVLLTHGIARWLYEYAKAEARPACRWQFRWSVAIVSLVVIMFASTICMIVFVHESSWLLTSDKPWFEMSGARQAARRMTSVNNLKQIGLAFHNYAMTLGRLPAGGTFTQEGEMLHSWETMLLPFMEHGEIKPNMTLPWDHPENVHWFRTILRDFINPGVRVDDHVDAQGYALSHYAANSQVIGANRQMDFKDVSDGLSTTILAGEVNNYFKPWGHPVNWRDPASGINESPDGFGGPWTSGGANFLMMDGSVRMLGKDIDPAVLRALSTPNGGEKVSDDF
jgi:prepilin-type processing-associated H-X9-DG protein